MNGNRRFVLIFASLFLAFVAGGTIGAAPAHALTCTPAVGTRCYDHHTNHAHDGMNPHYHEVEVQLNGDRCHWERLATTATAPVGVAQCTGADPSRESGHTWAAQP